MAKEYLAELEQLYEHKRKMKIGSTLQRLLRSPLEPEFERARSLRGPDFAKELLRLWVLTKDARFQDALYALVERRIIDGEFNFLPWDGPAEVEVRKQIELLAFGFIYQLTSRGIPLRRACAVQAAIWGWPATSFAAAMKDMELIYRRHLAADQCFSPDEFELVFERFKKFVASKVRHCGAERLEFPCSTSIPTTADG